MEKLEEQKGWKKEHGELGERRDVQEFKRFFK